MASSKTDRNEQLLNGLNDKHEPHVYQHLAKVYVVLCVTTAITAASSMLQMKAILDLNMIAVVGSILLPLGLYFYRDNGKNYYSRLAMLFAFGFCCGQSVGPLLEYVASINASIIITALFGTMITFASLTLAALLAERTQFLFLGGVLVSVVNTMILITTLNLFFKSILVQKYELYIGVFIMAAAVLFDTQNIIEKFDIGNRDVVQHALELFWDVLKIFYRLLIILAHKEKHKRGEVLKRR